MIQLKLAVCAESVVRDAETNTVSVFNIIEDISTSSFPVGIPKLSALFMLERSARDPERVDCLVTLTRDDQEIGRVTIEGDFGGKLRTRVILFAQGVIIDEPGILTIALTVSGEAMGAWHIPVRMIESVGNTVD